MEYVRLQKAIPISSLSNMNDEPTGAAGTVGDS
jgi:hypothetical protein